jgi:hypothetical protein
MEMKHEDFIKTLSVYQYRIHIAPEDADFFGGLSDVTYQISQNNDGIYYSDQGPSFITTKPIEDAKLDVIFPNGMPAVIAPIARDPKADPIQDRDVIMRIMARELTHSIRSSGFRIRGYSAFDLSEELVKDIRASDRQAQDIIEQIGVYPGFHFRIRKIDNLHFLQISPKSTIEFKSDIHSLIKSGRHSIQFLQDFCERVKLADEHIVDLRRIDNKTCDDQINEKPYNGMTYLDYVNSIADRSNLHSDPNLLVVLLRRQNALTYATSEGAKPVIDFSHLANLDSSAYASITKKMKRQSAERHKLASSYSKKIQLDFSGIRIKLGGHRRYLGNAIVSNFNEPIIQDRGFHFSSPFVTLLDRTGNIKHVSDATGDKGAPQDLLTGKYMPYTRIESIRLLLLAIKGYESAASQLKEALFDHNTANPSDRILRYVGCKFEVSEIQTVEPESTNFSSLGSYDCALIVGPKENLGIYGSYVLTELALLERGIPGQYIIHAPNSSPYLDKSVGKKINETYSFLTLILSILAKVGANSIVISSESTRYFPDNSAILSYNFARVFEAFDYDIAASLETMKASLPLAAAVSILDTAGAQIIHQYPHVINDETALFRGDRGKLIFDKIPDNSDMIVIHKDGMFNHSELSDIEKLRKPGIRIQPISIVTNAVPRIITSDKSVKYVPKAGAVIPVSNSEFLLSTTQIPATYDPLARGWPNPLSIKIHDLDHQDNTSTEQKWKLLYQIWCLTRAHPATIIPTRRPISIHYSNKMARFLRKSRKAQPEYFTKFADKKNRFNLYPRPFM